MPQRLSETTSDNRAQGPAVSALREEELRSLYRGLMLARGAENSIREEYSKDEMKTPVHLGIGQEAISVGVCHALPQGTRVFGTYRNHALYLAMTGDTDGFFAELYGKASGPGRGKAGSMHLAFPDKGLVATSAVVGTTVPVAVGAALAAQYRKSDQLTAVFFGDGAVEEGAFWESLNFACLRRLKILFVCEDNGLAIHTPAAQRQGFRSIPEALMGFRCHVATGEGSDLAGVVEMTRKMLRRMEQEPGPGFLHLSCFRFLEHVGPREDFGTGYRQKPAPEEMERLDPVIRFEKDLSGRGIPPAELEIIRSEAQRVLARSVELAKRAPFAPPAELYTDLFASSPPAAFPPSQGSSTLTFRQALSLAVQREMEADPSVFVFGLDVPDHKQIFGSTAGLLEKFGPDRVFGTPLSEDAMTGAALGAALSGLRPVHVHIRVDFMLLAMNQIVNMISNLRYMTGGKVKIPLVIRAVIGRGWGQSAQHSKSLQGVFAHFPGLKVLMPATAQEAYSMLRAAIREENPVIFLEHRWLYDVEGPVDEGKTVPIGPPGLLRSGNSVTVLATSWMNIEAMKAAELLALRGIELEVLNVRSISPLQPELIFESVRKTGRCIVADYDWTFCGFSAELASQIQKECFGSLKSPVERLGFAHVPCPTTRPLENLFYPSAVGIIRAAEKMLGLPEADLSGETFYSYEQKFKGPF